MKSTATKIWYTKLEGYRQRVANIPRGRNPYRLVNPWLENADVVEWYDGWDMAERDLKGSRKGVK